MKQGRGLRLGGALLPSQDEKQDSTRMDGIGESEALSAMARVIFWEQAKVVMGGYEEKKNWESSGSQRQS